MNMDAKILNKIFSNGSQKHMKISYIMIKVTSFQEYNP
jgi:hypothetical protein